VKVGPVVCNGEGVVVVLASGLIDKPVTVPWWNHRAVRLVQ
jgi:hypothetical protein